MSEKGYLGTVAEQELAELRNRIHTLTQQVERLEDIIRRIEVELDDRSLSWQARTNMARAIIRGWRQDTLNALNAGEDK